MNRSVLLSALLCVSALSGCQKPASAPPAVVIQSTPGPTGPTGATGTPGATGMPGFDGSKGEECGVESAGFKMNLREAQGGVETGGGEQACVFDADEIAFGQCGRSAIGFVGAVALEELGVGEQELMDQEANRAEEIGIVAGLEHAIGFGIEEVLQIASGLGDIAGGGQFRDFGEGFARGDRIVDVDRG